MLGGCDEDDVLDRPKCICNHHPDGHDDRGCLVLVGRGLVCPCEAHHEDVPELDVVYIDDACRQLDIAKPTARRLVAAGRLCAVRETDRRDWVTRESLDLELARRMADAVTCLSDHWWRSL